MTKLFKFLFQYRYAFFVLLFLGTPAYIYAQAVGASGLVPCGAVSSVNYLDPNYYLSATSCNFCYFAKLIQNVVNFLVMVTIPISVAMFAWAGIKFFTAGANPKNIAQAKTIFRSVFIGFIITISGWLVVQVILQNITNQSFYLASSWTNLDCSEYNQYRARNKNVSDIFSPIQTPTGTQYPYPTTPTTPGTPTTSGGPAVNPIDVSSVGPNGVQAPIALSTSQSDQALAATYDQVQARYGDQIQAACANSSLPNCTQLVTATIAAESGGNPNAVSSTGARGLMQAMPGSPGSNCASTDTTCQINSGTGYLSTIYQQFPNTSNALAGYNSGISTSPYPSGTKPGLASSSDCPGLYAWQCATNPGGLTETRTYIANICRTMTLRGSGC
ncbi:lytic transglycosylase domain-containing protein [Patescibacteria group bacterium]|nr:lytic transglycosylase domain-containing protein [Patescibacteria group bacterium]